MFGAVRALHGDLYQGNEFPKKMTEDARKQILLQVVEKFAENMNPLAEELGEKPIGRVEIKILEKMEHFTPYTTIDENGKKIIYVPGLWLKEFSELFPKNADLKRKRGEPFKKYANRLYAKARLECDLPRDSVKSIAYKKIFKFHLRNLEDGQRAKQILAFCLNHELAHAMKKDYLLRGVVLSESLIVAAVSFPIFYALGLPGSYALVAAIVTGCAFKIWRDGALTKECEVRADLIAITVAPGTRDGAIHFFENLLKLEKGKATIGSQHPATKSRIAYLRDAG